MAEFICFRLRYLCHTREWRMLRPYRTNNPSSLAPVGTPQPPWPGLPEKAGQVDQPRIRESLSFFQYLKNHQSIYEGLHTWLVKARAMVAGLKWLACFTDQGKRLIRKQVHPKSLNLAKTCCMKQALNI